MIIIACRYADLVSTGDEVIIACRYADLVSTGDEVLIENSNILVPAKIISISNLVIKGKHFA